MMDWPFITMTAGYTACCINFASRDNSRFWLFNGSVKMHGLSPLFSTIYLTILYIWILKQIARFCLKSGKRNDLKMPFCLDKNILHSKLKHIMVRGRGKMADFLLTTKHLWEICQKFCNKICNYHYISTWCIYLCIVYMYVSISTCFCMLSLFRRFFTHTLLQNIMERERELLQCCLVSS